MHTRLFNAFKPSIRFARGVIHSVQLQQSTFTHAASMPLDAAAPLTTSTSVFKKLLKNTFYGAALTAGGGVGAMTYKIQHEESSKNKSLVNVMRRMEDLLPRNTPLAEVVAHYIFSWFALSPLISLNPITILLLFVAFYASRDNINFNVHNYLTAPEDAIKEVKFDQSKLISLINKYFPEVGLSSEGICQGLMMTWYTYQCLGKDLFAELDAIQHTVENAIKNHTKENSLFKLNKEQINLLKNIQFAQEGVFCSPVSPFTINIPNQQSAALFKFGSKEVRIFEKQKDIKIEYNANEIAKSAIDYAMANKGNLIRISPQNQIDSRAIGPGHAIGLLAQECGDKVIIKYFDSNLREASFTDASAAQKSIALLIKYGYEKALIDNLASEVKERVKNSGKTICSCIISTYEAQEKQAGRFWDSWKKIFVQEGSPIVEIKSPQVMR